MTMLSPQAKALITGASSGLGAAIADALQSEGIAVVNLDVLPSPNHDTILCNLADRQALDDVLKQLAFQGPFSHVILNAGVSATGPIETLPLDAMLRVIRINAEAPMVIASYMLSSGLIARGGRIVLISSLSHFTGYPARLPMPPANPPWPSSAHQSARRPKRGACQ
jgi:NAD(P)-dependent dehydrogenase (short-subunit alcohol dehydrogenase family)